MSGPKTKIFVGHLPDGCKNEDLQSLFSRYGQVKECDVINKYGFVHMSTQEEADEAIKHLNNYNFMGSSLSVEPSKSKLHPEPGAPGRAKTSRGGGRDRGGQRNGYGSRRDSGRDMYGMDFSNGYSSRSALPYGSDPYYERSYSYARERLRPYPSPYDRLSPGMMSLRDEYARRSLPPLSSSDPYGRPLAPLSSRDEVYDHRPMLESRSDYLYSRRSPPSSSLSRPYFYGDTYGDSSARSMPLSATRRPAYY